MSQSASLNVRQAPVIKYHGRHNDFMEWDIDDGHQYRTQFTLRRAKPFGENKAKKPLTTAMVSGMNKQNEILFVQEGSSAGRPSDVSSISYDQSANSLTTQASSHTSNHSTQPSSLSITNNISPAMSQSSGYSSSQSSHYPNKDFGEVNTSQSNFGTEKQAIQFVQTTDSTDHNIGYFSPSKIAEGGQFPIRPDSQNTAASFGRPITFTNTQSNSVSQNVGCTGGYFPDNSAANNCHGEKRPSKSFDLTHSTSVISAVGVEHSKSAHSHEPEHPIAPQRPYASQRSSSVSSGAGSGLYFGTSEIYAFRSNFETKSQSAGEDVSGNDFILSLQDLVKRPLLNKLHSSDLYNAQYKTLANFQQSSSSSSSQSSSSGFSSGAGSYSSNFPRDFPTFSSSSSLGFQGGLSSSSSSSAENAYFFQT